MKKEVIFSGIQPSGNLTIGNYIGAIQQWVKLQNDPSQEDTERIFCIVDLHAITVAQDPKVLKEKSLEIAAIYVACGIDQKKSNIFIQSENPDHPYLAWAFDCITPYAWLTHMTQFKEKSAKQKENTSVGLVNYPALMAADILLYDTTTVPVGDDQTQHIELTCDIANRFNRLYGETFVLPKAKIDKDAARIMSLQNPLSKMSKSDSDPRGAINLLDEPDVILKKIKSAVTDSGSAVDGEKLTTPSEESAGLHNLLVIYSKCKDISYVDAIKENDGKRYGDFKKDLAEVVISMLNPMRERYYELKNDMHELQTILDAGRDYSLEKSSKKVRKVRELMGLGR